MRRGACGTAGLLLADQLGLDCRYCHSFVDVAGHSNVPSGNTCWDCHQHVQQDSPKLAPLHKSMNTSFPGYDGKPIEWSGPWYRSMEITDKGIKLNFDHAKGGLVAKEDRLTGFAIAGKDRKFVWADAVIDGKSVIVSSPKVPNPIAVRYGWDANPNCGLYNQQKLPAVPFRTDTWPTATPINKP